MLILFIESILFLVCTLGAWAFYKFCARYEWAIVSFVLFIVLASIPIFNLAIDNTVAMFSFIISFGMLFGVGIPALFEREQKLYELENKLNGQ
jgi:hypothetical protein